MTIEYANTFSMSGERLGMTLLCHRCNNEWKLKVAVLESSMSVREPSDFGRFKAMQQGRRARRPNVTDLMVAKMREEKKPEPQEPEELDMFDFEG